MAEHTNRHADEGQSSNRKYETRDIKVRPLVMFVVGLTVLLVFTFLVILWVFRLYSAQRASQDIQSAPGALTQQGGVPSDEQLRWPTPRVQSRPADDLKAMRAEEDRLLTTYGWVDRNAGVVRVPIDVAMKLIEKEGLPVRGLEPIPSTTATPGSAAVQKSDRMNRKPR